MPVDGLSGGKGEWDLSEGNATGCPVVELCGEVAIGILDIHRRRFQNQNTQPGLGVR